MDRFDVLIIGGGMVGATLACALQDSGMKIGLIEASPPADIHDNDPVTLRVSAITRASQQVFTALNAWPGMAARRVSPFREMRVWDAGGEGAIHFDAAELGEDTLGHIIENAVVQRALWETLTARASVELLCPAVVTALQRIEGGTLCRLQDGREVRARLLVGADGAQSRVRRFARIQARGWSYDQQAVVTTVVTEHSHRETAWQRFLPTGPLAFLPLHDGRSSIVWSTSSSQARQLLQLDDDEFCRQLESAFAARLGRIEACSERVSFPLRLQYVDSYVQSGLALVGDAAHTVHPLAGQGVNLGILDAACLAEVVLAARAQDKDIAALKVLRRYERWRKGDNLLMMYTMDGFKRLFGTEWEPLRWLRNTGLRLTDNLPPVKQLVMNHAMGRNGDLPDLARRTSAEQFSAM